MDTPAQQPLRPTPAADPRRTALWASAAILGGLLAVQLLAAAPPLGGGGGASGGMVSQRGAHTILTADANNEDITLVLDGRTEQLFVYRTNTQSGIQMFQKLNLPTVFADAKARSFGK
ncbi:MAG: hypothetical protein JSR77_12410 [Planctomycetes bacterium]|nr:hypothetical protein [Planctomycetota bacterium]